MARTCILRLLVALAAVVAMVAPAGSQTLVDLQHQARGIDFTGAAYTKPLRAGGALPSTCMSGEGFLLTVRWLDRICTFASVQMCGLYRERQADRVLRAGLR